MARMARPALALPVVIDEDGTRLLPPGVDASRRQHGAQGSVLIRLIVRRRPRERVCLGCTLGHSLPLGGLGWWFSRPPRPPEKSEARSTYPLRAHTSRSGRLSAYAIVTATGTPSPRPWARNAIPGRPATKPSQMPTRRGSGPAGDNQRTGARNVASFRGCAQVLRIDGATGAVEWKLGGTAAPGRAPRPSSWSWSSIRIHPSSRSSAGSIMSRSLRPARRRNTFGNIGCPMRTAPSPTTAGASVR